MLRQRLTAILKNQVPLAAIDPDDPALRVGRFAEWDSLAHFNFLLTVEEQFQIRFSVEEISELKSLDEIAQTLINHGVQAS